MLKRSQRNRDQISSPDASDGFPFLTAIGDLSGRKTAKRDRTEINAGVDCLDGCGTMGAYAGPFPFRRRSTLDDFILRVGRAPLRRRSPACCGRLRSTPTDSGGWP